MSRMLILPRSGIFGHPKCLDFFLQKWIWSRDIPIFENPIFTLIHIRKKPLAPHVSKSLIHHHWCYQGPTHTIWHSRTLPGHIKNFNGWVWNHRGSKSHSEHHRVHNIQNYCSISYYWAIMELFHVTAPHLLWFKDKGLNVLKKPALGT